MMIFIQKYLALFPDYSELVSSVINYCLPASHRIIIKTKTLRIVIKEPREETLFQA